MRIYSVHLRRHGLDPDRDLVLVKDGFCWPAFFFSALWALWHGLWLTALLFLVLEVAVSVLLGLTEPNLWSEIAISLGLGLIIGFTANDLRRWTLARRGFDDAGDVVAPDTVAAEQRFLAHNPTVAADLQT